MDSDQRQDIEVEEDRREDEKSRAEVQDDDSENLQDMTSMMKKGLDLKDDQVSSKNKTSVTNQPQQKEQRTTRDEQRRRRAQDRRRTGTVMKAMAELKLKISEVNDEISELRRIEASEDGATGGRSSSRAVVERSFQEKFGT